MPSSVEIRYATPAETEAVFGLLMEMYAESGLVSLAPEKVLAQIAKCTERGGVLLAVLEGRIIGTAGLQFGCLWWTKNWHVEELWTFVTKEGRARRSSAGILLLKAMNEVALANNLPLIFGIFSPVRTNSKKRLFGRFGREVGASYIGGTAGTLFREPAYVLRQ